MPILAQQSFFYFGWAVGCEHPPSFDQGLRSWFNVVESQLCELHEGPGPPKLREADWQKQQRLFTHAGGPAAGGGKKEMADKQSGARKVVSTADLCAQLVVATRRLRKNPISKANWTRVDPK